MSGTSGIFTIELYSFPKTNSWIYDMGCGTRICNTIQGHRGIQKLNKGALDLYVGNGNHAVVKAIGSFDFIFPSGMMARKPFTLASEMADDLLRLMHSDVCGPFRTTSREGAKYYVTFTDDFSRYGLPPYVYILVNHHTEAKEIWDRVKLLIKGTELSLQERESKLYKKFDRFTSEKGKSIYSYYLSKVEQVYHSCQLARDMHEPSFDQLYVYLRQHKDHVNEVWIMREGFPNPLALSYEAPVPHQPYHGPVIHSPPVVPQQAYQPLAIQQQPQVVFTQLDSGVSRSVGSNTTNQAKVVRCYNCQGEGHMAKQCTKPKRPKNSEWFKEKMLLAQALESNDVLDEEQMTSLVDNRDTVITCQASQ
ncbi:reverse transcriptase domain, reverse transcriptase zinc-binding domain protein [Tanacetum coccineum]|uniref:Reverse transcriptase domain, reverse transcriptase zinc-binding domain protein n=1 Tax=Tanacetum coccineum TaxID=301880 RepID=A0ABQ4YN40_9ASTR